jgi:hypothetical protein
MYLNPRWKQAPTQFRLLLLTGGATAGWLMVLIASALVLLLAPKP